jgi:hypothetical protein
MRRQRMNHSKTAIVAVVAIVSVLASCKPFVGSDPAKASGAMGKLSVSVPFVSSRVQEALDAFYAASLARGRVGVGQARAAGASRAMLLAQRVVFDLENSSGDTIAHWYAGDTASTNITGPEGSNDVAVPVGTGYTLKAKVFNKLVSATEPVVTGELGGIAVTPNATTSVIIPCIPNPVFLTDMALGETVSGSLVPLVLRDVGGPVNYDASERWYRLNLPLDTDWIEIASSFPADDLQLLALLFGPDGKTLAMSNNKRIGGALTEAPIRVGVSPGTSYYLGVVAASTVGSDPVDFSLASSPYSPVMGIANGDFSQGTDGWSLRMEGSSAPSATFDEADGAGVVAIASGGDWYADVALANDGFLDLAEDASYHVSFRAKTSAVGNIIAPFITPNIWQADSRSYEANGQFALTTTQALYDFYFTKVDPSCLSTLEFRMGSMNGHPSDGRTVTLDDVSIEPATVALDAPVNVSGIVHGKEVSLTWAAVAGASGYAIFRQDLGCHYFSSTEASFSDLDTEYSTAYSYRVRARLANGLLGPESAAYDVTTGGPLPPILAVFYVSPNDFSFAVPRYSQHLRADFRNGTQYVTDAVCEIDGNTLSYGSNESDYSVYIGGNSAPYIGQGIDVPASAIVDGVTFTGTAHTLPYPTIEFSWGPGAFDRTIENTISINTNCVISFGDFWIDANQTTSGQRINLSIDSSSNNWILTLPAYSIKENALPTYVYKVYRSSEVTASDPARLDKDSRVLSILQIGSTFDQPPPTAPGSLGVVFE